VPVVFRLNNNKEHVSGVSTHHFLDHEIPPPETQGGYDKKFPGRKSAGMGYLSICEQAKTESHLPVVLPLVFCWHPA
jgi:hypothetical protein